VSAYHEMNRNALREHHQLERETLDRVQAEAMRLERLPEGEEARNSTVLVDGEAITPTPRRIRGKLTVRW
jgi:hypothetical protein